MEKYLMIFRGGTHNLEKTLSPEAAQKNMAKWGAWFEKLAKAGLSPGGDPLENQGRVVRGTRKVITDGPYSESKDLVTGYLSISAKDLAHASEIALECPIFEVDGSVEIRAVREM